MESRADRHLSSLAAEETAAKLTGLGFDWTELDRNVAAATRFKRLQSSVDGCDNRCLHIIGLLGGASSGKSTLFNSLLGREASRVSGHAHETLGPIAAVSSSRMEQFAAWMNDQVLMPGWAMVDGDGQSVTRGAVRSVVLLAHDVEAWDDTVLVDLPDVTSKLSDDEGAVTRNLLPWFDGLLIVVDEERWFDAAVFDDTVEFSRNLGPRYWVVFNRTEDNHELTGEHRGRLVEHAKARHAVGSCVSPYQPGLGYRPIAGETCDRIHTWTGSLDGADRTATLEGFLRRRCSEIFRENVSRSEAFDELQRRVDKELSALSEATNLSTDLLTTEERLLLSVGHRFVPFFELIQGARQRLDRFRGRGASERDIDFDKGVDGMAAVLRHNLEHRFRRATDTIDRVVHNSSYLSDSIAEWRPQWRIPAFDERDWAARIREHLSAWKTEAAKQSRQGDVAALAVGMPLLVADLLFLGGAGMTLGWTAAWAAGFFGGKGLVRAFQGSPAFVAYQTTVRAYQGLIRESLGEQCQANFRSMPRRHLSMSDPALEAILHWSSGG